MIKLPKFLSPVLIFALFLSGGCNLFDDPKTEEEKLPKATQTGKNTFGCLVNGKAWVTETSIDAEAFYQEGVLSIGASTINQGIGLSIRTTNLYESNFVLDSSIDHFAQFGDQGISCLYVTTNDYAGLLRITYFNQNLYIISGTFEFEAYSDDCDEVLKITKGRFDLTYAP